MELVFGPVRTLSVLFDGRRAWFCPQAFGEGGPLHACHLIWCELIQLAKAYRPGFVSLCRFICKVRTRVVQDSVVKVGHSEERSTL